ncbi:MAG: hypothetical protein KDA44_09490 [Planctomycetales bacterium]|nr:hypothetical protein [Planctomycetales bacterium]
MESRVLAFTGTFVLSLAAATSVQCAAVLTGDVTPSLPWNSSSDVLIGDAENGTLAVDAGSELNNRYAYLGSSAGATGSATVSGNGARWTNSALFVGQYGSGSLRVEAGAQVSSVRGTGRGSAGRSYIGLQSESTGEVLITGVGSQWTNSENLYVGLDGAGTLRIEAGGQINNKYKWAHIGYSSGSTGAATVTGVGSQCINSDLFVGTRGSGSLRVEAGGQIDNSAGCIGYSKGSTGEATITGAGSQWTIGRDFYVGRGGAGSLRVETGGQINSASGYIGDFVGSTGKATIAGAGSQWTNSGDLFVGRAGHGSLTVADGGQLTAGTLFASLDDLHGDGMIAATAGAILDTDLPFDSAHGTQVVVGFGSGGMLTVTAAGGDLGAGYKGLGSLTVADGIAVTSEDGYLGYSRGSTGSAKVTGAGSQWTSSDGISVGLHGNGMLRVEEGARVTSSHGHIGLSSTSTSEATITGVGSEWTSSGSLTVGAYGRGALTVADGAHVSDGTGYIGSLSGSTGTAMISGAGSQWSNSENLYVGLDGAGTLRIEAGGLVNVAGTLFVDDSPTYGDSRISIATGGMLALHGDAEDSLAEYLDLVDGTDAIYYWDEQVGEFASITSAIYGDDYTLRYFTGGDLAGYTVLTVGTISEPRASTLVMLFSLAIMCSNRMTRAVCGRWFSTLQRRKGLHARGENQRFPG